ncbi:MULTISPECIES: hypothetical protein [unclassified Streptomyces]|uniref:hypothetical protein n=1 Tax=unclassified Streptomyces TaxID=2593676 RepID=UPI000DBAB869|nr:MULTISPECIES: hypothetical protein [unclassified Streptomyces]MYT71990.1 hypothetical protein [Streptomyces sp. SID8367]RAJ75372.1 hypothetical protein K377_06548 [Streptomyces sp. PsTaAH-137]
MGETFRRALMVAATTGMALTFLTDGAVAAAGHDERGTYINAAGKVEYQVHLPPGYRPGKWWRCTAAA